MEGAKLGLWRRVALVLNSSALTTPEDRDESVKQIVDKVHPPLSDEENPTLEELFQRWQQANKSTMVESSFVWFLSDD